MSFEFTVSDVIPAAPQEIYEAWLSPAGHTGMTGAKAESVSPVPGGAFTVWNGYITGKNLELEPGKRIVQSWRTAKFADADPDSNLEVTLVKEAAGTRITIKHTNVPDGHTSYRDGGWQENYFDPMKGYFAKSK
jgi:activator of HSP90 ATPase